MSRTIVTTAGAGLAALGLLALAPAASATAPAQHCAADIASKRMVCAASQDEAVARMAATQKSAKWVAHVILYDGTGYSGASLTLGGGGSCTATTSDVDSQAVDLGAWGWSNRASSFVTRNRCDMKGWDGTNFTGAHFAKYQDHDIKLTTWNNRISSYKVS